MGQPVVAALAPANVPSTPAAAPATVSLSAAPKQESQIAADVFFQALGGAGYNSSSMTADPAIADLLPAEQERTLALLAATEF
jgi:hypothetical protein